MTHVGYILTAYAATVVVLVGMIAWVFLDLATQKRSIARLEAEGKRRGSGASQ